jgi:ABC-2 type transport system permease protein
VRAFGAGVRYEWQLARTSPAELSWLFVAPLYTMIFLAIVRQAGRTDLAAYAVLGPAVMALVGASILTAGNLIDRDRFEGLLELEVAAPGSFALTLGGRICAVVSIGLLAVPEAWLVAGVGFGQWVTVDHPLVFVLTLLLTLAAVIGTGIVMAAVFVLARSARIFQNSLSYPLFVLGGAIVPTTLLPGWMQPLSRLVYLSWATDLLRVATAPGAIDRLWWRWAALAGLGALNALAGTVLVDRIVRRLRTVGTVAYA